MYTTKQVRYETMSLEKGSWDWQIIDDDVVVRVKVDYGGNLFEAIGRNSKSAFEKYQ
ncbi:MAG: hypothetical protein V8Q77_00335 [Bacilli bacterium]